MNPLARSRLEAVSNKIKLQITHCDIPSLRYDLDTLDAALDHLLKPEVTDEARSIGEELIKYYSCDADQVYKAMIAELTKDDTDV
jgi:hypothetical protein